MSSLNLSSLNLAKHRGSLGIIVIATMLTVLLVVWMGFDFRYFSTAPIGDQGDTLQDTWALYQGMDNLLHRPFDLGYSTIFYNDPASFAYTTAPYGASLMSLPLYLLTNNLELTHNIFFMVVWIATAWAAYLLIRYLFKPTWIIAVVGALMVSFSQYRVVHIIHIFELCAFLYLFCLLCLHHLIDTPNTRWAVGLAASFFFTLLTSGYLGMMFVFSGGIILVYALVRGKLSSRFYKHLIAACILGGMMILPFIAFRYGNARFRQGQTYEELLIQSSSLEELFSGSSVIYRGVTPIAKSTAEAGIFIGFVPLILAALAWRWRPRGEDELPTTQHAFSTRDLITLYAIITIAAYLITLGPVVRFGGKDILPSPFLLLMQLPGFGTFRALARFILIAITSTALLSVYSLTVMAKRLNENAYLTLFLVVVVAFTLESIPYNGAQADGQIATKKLGDALRLSPEQKRLYPVPQNHDVPVYHWLASQPSGTAIFEFPADIKFSYQYLMDIQLHNQPILNGSNVAYYPDWFNHSDWRLFPTAPFMIMLRERHIQYILVHHENLTALEAIVFESKLQQLIQTWGPIPLIGHFGTVDVYQVTESQPLKDIVFGFETPPPGDGWYPPSRDANGDIVTRTGPDKDSTLRVKLAQDHDARIVFTIQETSSPEALSSLQLMVNGVQILLSQTANWDSSMSFEGVIPQAALSRGAAETILTFHIEKNKTIGPRDPETSGVLFTSISIHSIEPLTPDMF